MGSHWWAAQMFFEQPFKWAPVSQSSPFLFHWAVCPGVQLQRECSIIYRLMLCPVLTGPSLAARHSWDAELFASTAEGNSMWELISDCSSSPARRKELLQWCALSLWPLTQQQSVCPPAPSMKSQDIFSTDITGWSARAEIPGHCDGFFTNRHFTEAPWN